MTTSAPKPRQVEQKVVDPENELNNVQRIFKKLAPVCSVAKRAMGVPQLAPQEKQLDILMGELHETKLCISMATKGLHALHDGQVKKHIKSALTETEELGVLMRDQKAQLDEVSCLNYLSQKKLTELSKQVMTEADELAKIENALNRLRQSENRLEIATKRFCVVNYDNANIRQEIQRLLVERKDFNVQWNGTIDRLVKGKLFLMDIFEIANAAFGDRDDCCRKLDALKWKGLFGLNRDISEMQQFECELNHLTKLEMFLRVKGSRRVCEADEKEERARLDEIDRCEKEIARHDALLNEIFAYTEMETIADIVASFKETEISNFSKFLLLCQCLQESIITKEQMEIVRKLIVAQREFNDTRTTRENTHLLQLREELETVRKKTQTIRDANNAADNKIINVMKGIEELVRLFYYTSQMAKCNIAPLQPLLGPHGYVTRWNVNKFLRILEDEIKTLIQIAYGQVSPPTPARGAPARKPAKIVADPHFEILRPNRIDKLVDYRPCAYCVEDYMMNLVFETPAEVATTEYVDHVLTMEDVNTKFGIYTLTIPAKRHPYSGSKDKEK